MANDEPKQYREFEEIQQIVLDGIYETFQKEYKGVTNSGINVKDYNIARLLSPYSFKFGKGPATYRDAISKMLNISEDEKTTIPPYAMREGFIQAKDVMSYFQDELSTFTHPSIEDTSMGGNEAINSRWAFARDDDIINPVNALSGVTSRGGLGRVYNELYQSNQQILYITLGVPEFKDLLSFYANCVDYKLAREVNSGEASWSMLIGGIAGGLTNLAVKICLAPVIFVDWLADKLTARDRITKYYELRGTMAMFYRYANTLFSQVAVLMGMTRNGILVGKEEGKGGTAVSTMNKILSIFSADNRDGSGGKSTGATYKDLYGQAMASLDGTSSYIADAEVSMPMFMRGNGPNIYGILKRRDLRYQYSLLARGERNPDKYLKITNMLDKQDGGLFDTWSNRLMATCCGADKFVGFRIDKNTEASETISNQTGPSSIANMINSAASAGRDTSFSAGGSATKFGGIVGSIPGIGALVKGVADFGKGLIDGLGVAGIASAVLTGTGFVDIPEIWTGSSMAKSYSFTMKFRPGAGDNATILQDCYLPLCMLLAMACPRSVGQNSFTTPFIGRFYCKGMFGVPIGIIDSLSITRGASDFGWNMSRLPTVITVNMSVKDLSPVMHLALSTDASSLAVFGASSPIQEYCHTLAGTGLAERMLFASSVSKRFNLAAQLVRSTWLNQDYWATEMGHGFLGNIIGAFSATTLMPN